MSEAVEADTYPPRYKAHKYWGKKPANVIASCIERFTRPGDRILDPFCGSGVTVTEAVLLGRDAIGIDLNPIALRIARSRSRPVSIEGLLASKAALDRRLRPIVDPLRKTDCAGCGEAFIRSTVWEGIVPVRVKVACKCSAKAIVRAITNGERARALSSDYELPLHPDAPLYAGWQMRKLSKAGLDRFSDLFTRRNLFVLAHLWRAIREVEDPASRDLLLLTFTANVAQGSKMIADYSGGAGGPSWKLNSYWLPRVWQELDPWHYFENRFAKTLAACEDTNHALSVPRLGTAELHLGDAAEVIDRCVEPGSVDFVFTDPPYGGEGIQYGELSMLWNLWLEEPQDLRKEIAFNPNQEKDMRFYAEGLERSFSALARVLSPDGRMAVTFNNKDPDVWTALHGAVENAGLEVLRSTPLTRSAPGLTEANAPRAPKVDMLLELQRRRRIS